MALIDVDKVISGMQAVLDEKPQDKGTPAYYAFEAFIERLKGEPTVDAVKVVRCKDCVYYDFEKCCPLRVSGYFFKGKPFPHENDFCSYGEKRDNND